MRHRYHQIKILVIYLLALLFAILNLGVINAEGLFNISLPLLEIMIIYHFTIYHENIFGFWFIFLIGIISDAINGLPLGISSLAYILIIKIAQIIIQKRSAKENFKAVLIEFTLFLSAILIFKWLLISIYHKNWLNLTPLLMQIVITSLAYIILYRFFEYLSENFLGKEY